MGEKPTGAPSPFFEGGSSVSLVLVSWSLVSVPLSPPTAVTPPCVRVANVAVSALL